MWRVFSLFIFYIVETKSRCIVSESSRLSRLNKQARFIDINRELGFLGIRDLEEPNNLEKCKVALRVIAEHYLPITEPDGEVKLIQSMHPNIKMGDITTFEKCEAIIENLVEYLSEMQRTMKYGHLWAIPYNRFTWNSAKSAIESFCLRNCPNGTDRDYLISVLNNESLTTVNDFINAFYNASGICGHIPRNEIEYWFSTLPNLPPIRDFDTDDKKMLFLLKELRKTYVDVKAKVAKYNYLSLLETRQREWSPDWVYALNPMSKKTLWRIIVRRRNSIEVKMFLKRLSKLYPGEHFAPERIAEYIVRRYSTESKDTVYAEDFPSIETDEEWETLAKELKLNYEDMCILKSIAKPFKELEEIFSVTTHLPIKEDTYLHLINVPYDATECELEEKLKAFINDENIKILYVIIVVSARTGKKAGEAIVEFLDQKSRDAAFDKLNSGKLTIQNRIVRPRKLRNTYN